MADALTEIGSDYLQGYLFSKPLPIAEFVEKYSVKAG
jgi:EAL domain-containing protein (putative c-di-GMP-specific phosphodiesterase class I)